MLLLAGFQVLLHRYSGQEDIVVGTPVANRTQAELEGMIGFFVNTLVIRSEVEGEAAFRSLLQQVKASTLAAYDHQQVPFEKVVERVVKERDRSRSPLVQVLFSLQNKEEKGATAEKLEGLGLSEYAAETLTSQFDLTVTLSETAEGTSCQIGYSTALFSRERIERMGAHYTALLKGIVRDTDQRIGEIDMLTEEERHQLVDGFNDTEAAYPRDKTIVSLFGEQVLRTPDQVAVVFEGESLTYRELEERSNRLGHYLQQQGVGPDALFLCVSGGAST